MNDIYSPFMVSLEERARELKRQLRRDRWFDAVCVACVMGWLFAGILFAVLMAG